MWYASAFLVVISVAIIAFAKAKKEDKEKSHKPFRYNPEALDRSLE